MPGINLEALKASEKFKSLSPETQKAVLGKLGYGDSDDGWETARQAILPALNPNLGMRAGNPFAPGVSSQGTESIQEPVMAGPMGPTYAGDAEAAALTGGAIAAPMAGGAALGALGLARAGSAYSGASQGGKRFGVPGAIVGGVVGALNPVAGGLAGAAEGYEAYGIPGAVLGGIGAAGQIPRLTALLRGAPKAAQVAAKASEVAQAAKAPAAVAQTAAPVAKAIGKVGPHVPGAKKILGGTEYIWGPNGGWFKAAGAGPAVTQAVKGPVNSIIPIASADELTAKIIELRQGMSGAQVVQALKQWHGIPIKDGNLAVKMVLGGK